MPNWCTKTMKRRHYCCIKNPDGMRPIFALIVFYTFVLAVDNTTESGLNKKNYEQLPSGGYNISGEVENISLVSTFSLFFALLKT